MSIRVFTIEGTDYIMIGNVAVVATAFRKIYHISLAAQTLKIVRFTDTPNIACVTGFNMEEFEFKLNSKVNLEQILVFVRKYFDRIENPEHQVNPGGSSAIRGDF